MSEAKLELKLSHEEAQIVLLSLGLFNGMVDASLDRWQNKKDSSLDKICGLLDKKMVALGVWRTLLISFGVPEDKVIEILARDRGGE